MTIKLIISGGQTGADRGGLEAARDLGIQTSGFAPAGYRTEKGADYALRDVFGLVESRYTGYPQRTLQNILSADLTVLFTGKKYSPGSALTKKLCLRHDKKIRVINLQDDMKGGLLVPVLGSIYTNNWIDPSISIINVAGNRESVCPGIQAMTRKCIRQLIEKYEEYSYGLR